MNAFSCPFGHSKIIISSIFDRTEWTWTTDGLGHGPWLMDERTWTDVDPILFSIIPSWNFHGRVGSWTDGHGRTWTGHGRTWTGWDPTVGSWTWTDVDLSFLYNSGPNVSLHFLYENFKLADFLWFFFRIFSEFFLRIRWVIACGQPGRLRINNTTILNCFSLSTYTKWQNDRRFFDRLALFFWSIKRFFDRFLIFFK